MKTIGAPLFLVFIFVMAFVPTVYGLFLAFKASIILGILALIVEPSPAIFGWLAIFGHAEVCKAIGAWLHLPF